MCEGWGRIEVINALTGLVGAVAALGALIWTWTERRQRPKIFARWGLWGKDGIGHRVVP